MIIVGAVVIVAVVSVGITMMGRNTSTKDNSPAMTAQISPAVQGAADESLPGSTATTINVEAGSFYYKPAEIKVKKGDKVRLVMKSKDMMHDFNIDELGVKIPITKSGETNEVEFVAEKAGTFEYYCSVGQHRSRGQVGRLIVE